MIYKVINEDAYHNGCEGVVKEVTKGSLSQVVYVMKFTKHSEKCLKKSEDESRFSKRSCVDKLWYWLYK